MRWIVPCAGTAFDYGAAESLNPPPPDHVSGAEQTRWFAEEVQRHEPALRAWLRSRYPTLRDVDDVVHESYLNLIRQQPAGRIAFTKAYLFTVARNAALKVFRKKRLFSDIPLNELPDWRLLAGGTDVTETVTHHQNEELMAEAIARLPARCGEIVRLRAVNGLSYAEIATDLGLSEATVRVQIARGITKCTHFLRSRGIRHDP
jgi:RNA polymerase sigma-70 factor (ECF subfamily)